MGLFGGGGPEISRETKAASVQGSAAAILAIIEGQQ